MTAVGDVEDLDPLPKAIGQDHGLAEISAGKDDGQLLHQGVDEAGPQRAGVAILDGGSIGSVTPALV